MTHPTDPAPRSTIISDAVYQTQLRYAGQYRVTSGGNRIRAWKPTSRQVGAMRALIIERDGKRCAICGAETPFLDLDHIKPYKHGGLFIESNLQLACWPCNGRKGARWDA